MEKAGILTLYYENYNFGGLLQAYALPQILNTKFKIDAEQIRYSLDVEEKCEDKSENKRLKLDSIAYKKALARMKTLSGKGGVPVPEDENGLNALIDAKYKL